MGPTITLNTHGPNPGSRSPHGYNHVALGLADPFLVERWSGRRLARLPPLHEQLELLYDHVLPFNAAVVAV